MKLLLVVNTVRGTGRRHVLEQAGITNSRAVEICSRSPSYLLPLTTQKEE